MKMMDRPMAQLVTTASPDQFGFPCTVVLAAHFVLPW
jgi:hypothetical protein